MTFEESLSTLVAAEDRSPGQSDSDSVAQQTSRSFFISKSLRIARRPETVDRDASERREDYADDEGHLFPSRLVRRFRNSLASHVLRVESLGHTGSPSDRCETFRG